MKKVSFAHTWCKRCWASRRWVRFVLFVGKCEFRFQRFQKGYALTRHSGRTGDIRTGDIPFVALTTGPRLQIQHTNYRNSAIFIVEATWKKLNFRNFKNICRTKLLKRIPEAVRHTWAIRGQRHSQFLQRFVGKILQMRSIKNSSYQAFLDPFQELGFGRWATGYP